MAPAELTKLDRTRHRVGAHHRGRIIWVSSSRSTACGRWTGSACLLCCEASERVNPDGHVVITRLELAHAHLRLRWSRSDPCSCR
jgi:hypothetical protein